VTMISRSVEVSIAGGGGENVHGLYFRHLFSLVFFFFCNHAFIVLWYNKPHAALAMEKTKPIKHKT